jgi:hypothetical protein
MGRTHDVTISGFDLSRLESDLANAQEELSEARRLAEKYRNLSCETQDEADATLLPWEVVEKKSDRQIIEAAQRERLNHGLRTLASWCGSRAMLDHDTETTLTMLEKKAAELRGKVVKAGWAAINAHYAGAKTIIEPNE